MYSDPRDSLQGSVAQFQVSHPARLLPFLNHRKLCEGAGEKGWSANFQAKLAMLFLKTPHHLEERLTETDTASYSQEAEGQGQTSRAAGPREVPSDVSYSSEEEGTADGRETLLCRNL